MLKDGTLQNLDTSKPQMLQCVVCHPSHAASNTSHTAPPSKNTRNRVGIRKYTAEHGLSSMKKHVERDHEQEFVRYSKHAKEIEGAARDERQKGKKQKSLPPSSITNFFTSAWPYNKCDTMQIRFIEDLVLLISKRNVPLSMVETHGFGIWCCDVMHECCFLLTTNYQRSTFPSC